MAKRPRIFVDIDRTLLVSLFENPDWLDDKPSFMHVDEIPAATVWGWDRSPGEIVVAAARQSASAFLLALAQLGDVELLTVGGYDYQMKVLKKLGLLELVKSVWARDYVSQLPQPQRCRWLLVDDHEADHERVKTKFAWLGYPQSEISVRDWNRLTRTRFVQCIRWDEWIADEHPLTDLLPLIAEKLEQQRHRRRRE